MLKKFIVEEEQQRLSTSAEYRAKVFQMERTSLIISGSLFLVGIAIFALDVTAVAFFPRWVVGVGVGLMVLTAIRIVEGLLKIRRIKNLGPLASKC